jgi:hypothetical protein
MIWTIDLMTKKLPKKYSQTLYVVVLDPKSKIARAKCVICGEVCKLLDRDYGIMDHLIMDHKISYIEDEADV